MTPVNGSLAEMDEIAGPGEIMEISMGPHHPSTHGVFRMDVRLEGEKVIRLKPAFGYLHRNHEKIAEKGAYLAAIPYTDLPTAILQKIWNSRSDSCEWMGCCASTSRSLTRSSASDALT